MRIKSPWVKRLTFVKYVGKGFRRHLYWPIMPSPMSIASYQKCEEPIFQFKKISNMNFSLIVHFYSTIFRFNAILLTMQLYHVSRGDLSGNVIFAVNGWKIKIYYENIKQHIKQHIFMYQRNVHIVIKLKWPVLHWQNIFNLHIPNRSIRVYFAIKHFDEPKHYEYVTSIICECPIEMHIDHNCHWINLLLFLFSRNILQLIQANHCTVAYTAPDDLKVMQISINTWESNTYHNGIWIAQKNKQKISPCIFP